MGVLIGTCLVFSVVFAITAILSCGVNHPGDRTDNWRKEAE